MIAALALVTAPALAAPTVCVEVVGLPTLNDGGAVEIRDQQLWLMGGGVRAQGFASWYVALALPGLVPKKLALLGSTVAPLIGISQVYTTACFPSESLEACENNVEPTPLGINLGVACRWENHGWWLTLAPSLFFTKFDTPRDADILGNLVESYLSGPPPIEVGFHLTPPRPRSLRATAGLLARRRAPPRRSATRR